MKVILGLDAIQKPFINAVVAIGNFDGVHRGHQAIFNLVKDKARQIGGTSVAITFDPHPIRVLNHRTPPPLITLLEQKTELIGEQGIDTLVCIPFTASFAAITAGEFTEQILVNRIGMKAIVIGRDYTFGKNRQGNADFLKQEGKRLGFEVIVVDWIFIPGNGIERVSSTLIREVIEQGAVDHAKKLLGRHYQLRGQVTKGRNRGGRLLGFPTANITINDELCPKQGVYAVTVETADGTHAGVANIGYSPTFDDPQFTVEIHILDYSGDLYGKMIRVNFIRRIRDERKFDGIDQLIEQIRKDIETARTFLADVIHIQ